MFSNLLGGALSGAVLAGLLMTMITSGGSGTDPASGLSLGSPNSTASGLAVPSGVTGPISSESLRGSMDFASQIFGEADGVANAAAGDSFAEAAAGAPGGGAGLRRPATGGDVFKAMTGGVPGLDPAMPERPAAGGTDPENPAPSGGNDLDAQPFRTVNPDNSTGSPETP